MQDPAILRALRSLPKPAAEPHVVITVELDATLVELPTDLQADIRQVVETRQAERIESILFTPDKR